MQPSTLPVQILRVGQLISHPQCTWEVPSIASFLFFSCKVNASINRFMFKCLPQINNFSWRCLDIDFLFYCLLALRDFSKYNKLHSSM